VTPGSGASVDAIFTSPLGLTYTQPAFFYQDYSFQPDINGSGQDWIYPGGSFAWKVRLPRRGGRVALPSSAEDAGGASLMSPAT
jgi:hypothetical protein